MTRLSRRHRRDTENLREWVLEQAEPEPNSGCYLWTRTVNSVRRPIVSVSGKYRLVVRFLVSAPTGSVVRHTCDNEACINPDHLRIGTQKENIADCIARGRKTDPPRMARGAHPNTKIRPEMIPDLIALRNSGVATEKIGRMVGCSGSIVRRAIRTYDDTSLTTP